MPSAQLTVNVRADISKYQGILSSATGADKASTYLFVSVYILRYSMSLFSNRL